MTAIASSGDSVSDFNAKFSIYETVVSDDVTLNFASEGITPLNSEYAPQQLNTVSDVVTAINLAENVNYENNYGYKYVEQRGGIETTNAIEIYIIMGSGFSSSKVLGDGYSYNYYLLEPNENVESDTIYGTNSNPGSERENRISFFYENFASLKAVDTNTFLKNLNTTTVTDDGYTAYKYYFLGEYEISETTGKIYSLTFTLIENTYDDFE